MRHSLMYFQYRKVVEYVITIRAWEITQYASLSFNSDIEHWSFAEAKEKHAWSAFLVGNAWPKCNSGQFLKRLTSNCVCRIFSHFLGGWVRSGLAGYWPLKAFSHSWQARGVDVALNDVDQIDKIYVATDSTKDMHDEWRQEYWPLLAFSIP